MKKNLDWENIGFAYRPTDSRFVSMYTDGNWDEGAMIADPNVTISESSGVFQYAQTCFEGMKAYTTEDGHTVIFRPDLNAERMMTSCERLCLPVYPKEKFVDAVVRTVRANLDWVPPYGSGASLYIRPFMIGYSPVLGVSAAKDAMFRVFVSPVGPYFKGGIRPLKLKVSEYDRAAPRGTGDVKAGLNYAMSLHAIEQAHHEGYDENMYLDSATRTKVEETGGANFLFVTKDGTVVTPKSPTILPSITRRSLMVVAKDYLGLKCEEREVPFAELPEMAECGLCGTAAVISPVGSVVDGDRTYTFDTSADNMGPTVRKLYETLTGIQMGRIPAPEGWICRVD